MTAERLRLRRQGLGIEQRRVAELVRVNKITFNKWESGREPIPIRRVEELERLYGSLEDAVREFEEWREAS